MRKSFNLYEQLKQYGFSPMKAAEIALDVSRGEPYAVRFVGSVIPKGAAA